MESSPPPPYTPPVPSGTGAPMVSLPVRKANDVPYALIGLLSYLNILALVPLFVCAPESFEKYHAKQGTVAFILINICFIIGISLPPLVGSVLFACTSVVQLLFIIIGTRCVLRGAREPLPLIGDLTRLTHLSD